MEKSIKISASVACADLLNLETDIRLLEEAGVEYLHIDIMDGMFVPNFCLSFDLMKAIKGMTSIPMECHVMVTDPERYVERVAATGSECLSVHYEATPHIHRALTLIRQSGMKAGVALNPSTPINVLDYILDDLDVVTLMMINPGFTGQKMIPSMLRKLKETREFLDGRGKQDMDIIVDGNVSIENIPKMVGAGATVLVGGSSSVFRKGVSIIESVELVRSLFYFVG
jgi:ribulose-phosphate 3-epimerase